MRASHAAFRGVHDDFRSIFIAQHLRVLEDLGAGSLGGACHPQSEFEGVQVAAARVDQPSEVAAAPHVRLQFVAIQQAHRGVIIFLAQFMCPIVQFPKMARFDRDVNMVRVVVAIDGVLVDQRLREIQGLDRQIEQAPCIVAADFGGQRLLTHGEAKNGLSAASARGSITDGVRLEQGDTVAASGQVQRGRAAGDAAAEDRHIGAEVPGQ